jgi:glycosyltransferase involved in cell wall biosynthesis
VAPPTVSVPVSFVSSHARHGGSERYLELLVDELGADWVSEVVCLEDGPLVQRFREHGVAVTVIPTGGRADVVRAAVRLRRRLARTRPAVVHANGVKAGLVAAFATVGSRTPILWVKHDFSWDGPLTRFVAGRSTKVIGVSAAVLEPFESRDGKFEVVHNAIPPVAHDADAARERLHQAMGESTGPVVVLVGRLDPIKGHRELIAAAPAIIDGHPDVRFAFVGGEDPSHVELGGELRREAGEHFAFLGHRDDAVELLSGADVAAIPSISDRRGFGREGFPYVGLEALSVGTPVVGYRDGGLPELVGECGRLVAPGDREALAAETVALLADSDLRQRLAHCGKRRAAEEFSLERLVKTMQERYREAAKSDQ